MPNRSQASAGEAFAAAQFYDGVPDPTESVRPMPSRCSTGEHLTGIDAALVQGEHITRQVAEPNGAIRPCRVGAYQNGGHLVIQADCTDAIGAFDMTVGDNVDVGTLLRRPAVTISSTVTLSPAVPLGPDGWFAVTPLRRRVREPSPEFSMPKPMR